MKYTGAHANDRTAHGQARLVEALLVDLARAAVDRPLLADHLRAGFGRVVDSGTEPPHLFVNRAIWGQVNTAAVRWDRVGERSCNATMRPGPAITSPVSFRIIFMERQVGAWQWKCAAESVPPPWWVATGGKVISLQAGLLNLVFIVIEKRVLGFSYFRLFTNGIIQSDII